MCRAVAAAWSDLRGYAAAQLAYYFALALFPALLFIVALASYLPYKPELKNQKTGPWRFKAFARNNDQAPYAPQAP